MNKEKEMRGHLINMKVNNKRNNNLNNKIMNNENIINREREYNNNVNNLILEQRDLNNQQINYLNNKDYEEESKRQYNLYLNELQKIKNNELNNNNNMNNNNIANNMNNNNIANNMNNNNIDIHNKLNEEEFLKNKEEYDKYIKEQITKNPEIINQMNPQELNYYKQLQQQQIQNSNIQNEEKEKLNIENNKNINDKEYLKYLEPREKENKNNEINSNISYKEVIPNIKKDETNINLNEMSQYERLEYENYLMEKEGKNLDPEYLNKIKNYDSIVQEQPKFNNIEDEKKLLSSQNIINKRDNLIIKDPYTTKSHNLGNTNLEKNIISYSNKQNYNRTFNNCLVNGNRIISGRLQYAGNKIIG